MTHPPLRDFFRGGEIFGFVCSAIQKAYFGAFFQLKYFSKSIPFNDFVNKFSKKSLKWPLRRRFYFFNGVKRSWRSGKFMSIVLCLTTPPIPNASDEYFIGLLYVELDKNCMTCLRYFCILSIFANPSF